MTIVASVPSRRALQHREFHYVLCGGAISTTTTVGYGDIYPTTPEGRLIAVLLMLTGIGVIGVFTATIASLFMIEDEEDEFNGVHKRLDNLEAKLDRVLALGRTIPQEGGHHGPLHDRSV